MSKFNQFPNNFKDISNAEFTRIFYHYQKEEPEYRQMIDRENRKIIAAWLFTIRGTRNEYPEDGLGVALYRGGDETKFAIYGSEDDWKQFTQKFASQFAGDNS